MSTFKEKLSNLSNKFGFWITNGTSKTSSGKLILLGLMIMVPILLAMITPWLVWVGIAPEHRYDIQYNWLQDFMIIWPLALFGIMFLSVVGWLIYSGVKQSKLDKENGKYRIN